MSRRDSFTISTPLYYVNDKPHLGSSYTTIACDAIARFKRLENKDVIFITGVDEHGQKIQRTAESNNISPESHCDNINKKYKLLWNELNITYDRYIRTTNNNHYEIVKQFFKRVENSGDIFLGTQKGWYCVGCEEFKDISVSSKKPICEIHKKDLEWRDEENLFFRLSKYQNEIEELVRSESFIYPETRRNEIINFVARGLKDFSISRISVPWGLKVPGITGHTFYVWFDALVGYLTATIDDNGEIDLNKLEDKGWPADVHVIGKDILRFHAIYWPAMLLSAGCKLPKSIFGHGFLTREGQKMGKSLGNVLDPLILHNQIGNDSLRWYLLRDIQFGSDGDFQKQRVIDLINNDLANTIGNLLNRTISMSRKWYDNAIPIVDIRNNSQLMFNSINTIKAYKQYLNIYDFQKACESIINLATLANIYLNDQQPWINIKDVSKMDTVAICLYDVLETSRIIAILLQPIIPNFSSLMLNQLGYRPKKVWKKDLNWGLLLPGTNLNQPSPIINKLDSEINI